MTSGWDHPPARPGRTVEGLEAFIDAVEGELLRAGWLLTGSAESAVHVTASALASLSRHWKAWEHDQPRHHVFAALDAAAVKHPPDPPLQQPPPLGPSDRITLQQRAAEDAFTRLPLLERRCVVLRDYANLPTRTVAKIVDSSPKRADEAAERGLQLLSAESADLGGPPFDEVPCPASTVPCELVRSLTAQENSATRRRFVIGGLAGLTLVAVGGTFWWWQRPPTGRATIDQALKPLALRNSGRLFVWTRFNSQFTYGSVRLLTIDSGEDQQIMLTNRSGLSLSANGKPVALSPTPWKAWTYIAGRTLDDREARVIVAQVPPDTDAAWVVTGDPLGQPFSDETVAIGTELADHRTYAVGWALSAGRVEGLLWRTARQQLGLSSGEFAGSMSAPSGPTMFVLPRTKLWGVIDASGQDAQTMKLDRSTATPSEGMTPDGSAYSAILLPHGASQVQVQRSSRAATATVAVEPLGRTGFTGALAFQSRLDLVDVNDPTFSHFSSVSWRLGGQQYTWTPEQLRG